MLHDHLQPWSLLTELYLVVAKSRLLSLLINKLVGVLRLASSRTFLALEVPVVQVAATCRQIGCETKPAEVGNKSPRSDFVDLAPNVGKVSGDASKSNDINGSSNRALQGEEEGHPDEVKTELDGVKSCALL